jgi:hypothetical protein
MLLACISVVALALVPFALNGSGSAGLGGLAVAAAVCLGAGFAAEAISTFLARLGTPLAAAMVGMGMRMLPPLVLCVVLAATGASGRDHLPFVCYLFAFYFATLVMETWLAVKRVASISPMVKTQPRGLGYIAEPSRLGGSND